MRATDTSVQSLFTTTVVNDEVLGTLTRTFLVPVAGCRSPNEIIQSSPRPKQFPIMAACENTDTVLRENRGLF